MKSFTRRVERLKQSHRKTLLSCTALTALVFASPVLAAEYTVDSATIVENGAAENVLDGADTLLIVNGGSITPDAGEAVSSGNAGNTVLLSGNAVINSSDLFAILHAGADATTTLSDTASILINGGKGVLNDGASSLFTMTGDSEIFMQSTFSSAAIWNSGARDAAKGTTHVLHMQDNSKITVYSESNAILLEGAGHSVILEDFAYVDKLTDVTEKKSSYATVFVGGNRNSIALSDASSIRNGGKKSAAPTISVEGNRNTISLSDTAAISNDGKLQPDELNSSETILVNGNNNVLTASGSAEITGFNRVIFMQGTGNKVSILEDALVAAEGNHQPSAIFMDDVLDYDITISGNARVTSESDFDNNAAIYVAGVSSGKIDISGSAELESKGPYAAGINVSTFEYGINNIHISGSARVSAEGLGAIGLNFDPRESVATVSGHARVGAAGTNASGIKLSRDQNRLNILDDAVVYASGEGSAALLLDAGDQAAFISGTVKSLDGVTGTAIRLDGDASIQLDEGATLIGAFIGANRIDTHDLILNVGPQTSYILELSGPSLWNVEDLNGRDVFFNSQGLQSFFVGSLSASNSEIANEMLFERVTQLTDSVLANAGGKGQKPWADAYTGASERERGSGNIVDYETDIVGLSFGLPMASTDGYNVELVFNYQNTELDISNQSHVVESDSLSVGVVFSELDKTDFWNLKGYTFLGRTDYEGERELMANWATTGWSSIASDYSSDHMIVGAQANHQRAMANGMTLEGLLHANIAHEEIQSHTAMIDTQSNEAVFLDVVVWPEHTLTQATLGGSIGVRSQIKGVQMFGRLGLAFSDLLSNDFAPYRRANWNDGDANTTGTYVTGAMGLDYVSAGGIQFTTSLSGFSSDEDQTGFVANVGLEYRF